MTVVAVKFVMRDDRTHTFFYMDPPYLETAGCGKQFTAEE